MPVITVKNVPVPPEFPKRRPGWHRLVTKVDPTKTDGWAFEGRFLREGQHQFPVGVVVVQKIPECKGHDWGTGICYAVVDQGLLAMHEQPFDWKLEFLSFRDYVATVLKDWRVIVGLLIAVQAENKQAQAPLVRVVAPPNMNITPEEISRMTSKPIRRITLED